MNCMRKRKLKSKIDLKSVEANHLSFFCGQLLSLSFGSYPATGSRKKKFHNCKNSSNFYGFSIKNEFATFGINLIAFSSYVLKRLYTLTRRRRRKVLSLTFCTAVKNWGSNKNKERKFLGERWPLFFSQDEVLLYFYIFQVGIWEVCIATNSSI